MNKVVVICGADDVEMNAVEQLAFTANFTVVAAAVGEVRCHPGNAYKFNSLLSVDGVVDDPATLFEGAARVITVECAPTPDFAYPAGTRIIKIDHHKEGDYGWGLPADKFLEASSIGQLWAMITKEDLFVDPDEWSFDYFDGKNAHFRAMSNGHWQSEGDYSVVPVPRDVMYTAAADHCLEAAYRGRCPGIDPDALMAWRAESRATFQRRPVADVLADVEAARVRLRDALGDRQYADLRGESIPELPEAACREGVAYLATQSDRDGRKKVVLGGAASPELVRSFMNGEVVPGLTDYYGNPDRGFAGGYIS